MSKAGQRVLSILLWTFGGTLYFMLEVIYKTATGEPDRISWTMLVLAVILCVPVERAGAELPWHVPLWAQAACCAALVTVTELLAGLIINVWLDMNVWDYSNLPGNLWGQICPQFSAIWLALCLIFIPVFDWLRYAVDGGEKPHYYLLKSGKSR